MPVTFPFTSGVILPTVPAAPLEAGMVFWAAITPQLPREAIHGLLGGSDGMDCGRESFYHAKVVMDDLGWGSKQLVVQEALLTIFTELLYLWFTLITNMGHPQKGQR